MKLTDIKNDSLGDSKIFFLQWEDIKDLMWDRVRSHLFHLSFGYSNIYLREQLLHSISDHFDPIRNDSTP